MRSRILTVAIGAAALSSVAVAQVDPAAGWQPMTFHDLQVPSMTDPLQTLVWSDVIREANAYVTGELKRPLNGKNALITALSSTYRKGTATIIVSTISTRGCDNGANDKGAEIEASTCPLRIVTIDGGKVISVKTETGCYADHADPDIPAKNRKDNSYTRFDAKSGTIAFRTNVGGRDVARCARTYSIK
jgi:hypothetical protein